MKDPDRGQQLVIGLAASMRFATGIVMGTAMAVYVERAGSPFAASMVLAAFFVGTMVFAPVWGAIADVTRRRRLVLVLTGTLATLSILPLAFVGDDSVWLPIGLRVLYAVFAAGFPPVMLAIVSERGGDTSRGRSMGFYNSARAVGFTGGQVVAGALLGILAAGNLYLVVAGFSLFATFFAVFVKNPTRSDRRDRKETDISVILSEVRSRLLPAKEERQHLSTNGLSWLYVALALRNMTVLGVFSLMAPFLLNEVGMTEFVVGILLAINPAGQTVFMYIFGRFADRLGRKPLIALGMAGSGAFGLITAASTIPGPVVIRGGVAALGLIVIAASFSSMTTGALAFIGDVAPPTHESELMGLRSTAKGVGGVLGPLVTGAIATFASYEASFAVGSAFAFVATGIVVKEVVESKPPEAETKQAATSDD